MREAAAALEGHGGWESASGEPWTGDGMRYRARRVVVKAWVVKLKGVESRAIAAHLRYLQREGVTTGGQHGQAYSGEDERADTRAFIERGLEDRHQFRFIVAAEDGIALGELKPFTRQLMRQMEQDLDTALDWLAVDHFNTGQPHTMSWSGASPIRARSSTSPATTSPTASGRGRAISSPASSGGKASWRCSRD